MVARIIDGKSIAGSILEQLSLESAKIRRALGRPPVLAVILVGDDPASRLYVLSKKRACEKCDILAQIVNLPEEILEKEVLSTLHRLNETEEIDGIIVQLPLPAHLNEDVVIEHISPLKDVDGLHPENSGLMLSMHPRFVPATPLGVQRLMLEEGMEISGKKITVMGRSRLVGMPLVPLLGGRGKGADATVTLCHTKTSDIADETRRADILIVAAGSPEFVKASMVKPGAVVVDVGINRIETPRRKRGYRLVGDVAYDEVALVASAITPVPGGTGPMTVAMLVNNLVKAASMRIGNL